MNYITTPKRNVRPGWPIQRAERQPMTEDDLREAMMKDPATKRKIGGGMASSAQMESVKKMSEEASRRRLEDPTTMANRIRAAMRGQGPQTAHEIADNIPGGDILPNQVSNWCSHQYKHAEDIRKAGKAGHRALWELVDD